MGTAGAGKLRNKPSISTPPTLGWHPCASQPGLCDWHVTSTVFPTPACGRGFYLPPTEGHGKKYLTTTASSAVGVMRDSRTRWEMEHRDWGSRKSVLRDLLRMPLRSIRCLNLAAYFARSTCTGDGRRVTPMHSITFGQVRHQLSWDVHVLYKVTTLRYKNGRNSALITQYEARVGRLVNSPNQMALLCDSFVRPITKYKTFLMRPFLRRFSLYATLSRQSFRGSRIAAVFIPNSSMLLNALKGEPVGAQSLYGNIR